MRRQLVLLLAGLVISFCYVTAQNEHGNPFRDLGYKGNVYTLTDFEEFHDFEDVVEIGQVLYDTKLKKVVGLVGEKDHRIELIKDVISTSIDPHCEKYPWISPYAYCLNNPIKYIDPDGRDVWVKHLDDGTYQVVGGTANSDLNIYLVDTDGNRTDNTIGQMFTEYSFHNEDGSFVDGAIINPNDQSGQDFINNEIADGNPGLFSYMKNATGGKRYDFKARGLKNKPENMDAHQYRYRGMPLKDENGNTVYGSARDVGNYGVGYVAGRKGLNWSTTRAEFDGLQSWQDGGLSTEGMPSQKAQRLGYNAGSQQYPLRKVSNRINKLLNRPTSKPAGF